MTVTEVLQSLREMGCKLTPQRRMLIEVLLARGEAGAQADEIYQQVRETYPEVGLDTVYRNLRLFTRLGLVTEVKLPGRFAQFAFNAHSHRHGLVCLDCGREIPLLQCPIRELETIAREEHGFTISSHRIELFGYCSDCGNK